MSLAAKLLSASGGGVGKLYVDDVFSAYTYTGNGSTQTINNGIDLAGEGGLVWIKNRDSGTYNHQLTDTARGAGYALQSNDAAGQTLNTQILSGFTSTGFSIGTNVGVNTNAAKHISWTFRKAPKFFDVVTYTGNGVAGRQIPHALGIAPGMVIVKDLGVSSWHIYHRSSGVDKYLDFTTSAEASLAGVFEISDTFFSPTYRNTNGATYVAYLFAHDPSADGIVQCGSFMTDGSGNAAVNHGWSAGVKFAAIKASSTTGNWEMYDTARTAAWSGSDARLYANLTNAEDSVSRLSASGTSVSFVGLSASATYVYLFIVAPT